MSSLFLYASRLACAFLVALLAALLWAAAVPTAATAQTVYYVDAGAAPSGDGSSWAAAFDALPDALGAAQPGDAIWIAAGTYVPGPDRHDAFALKDDVALLGGFAGTEAGPAERTLGAAATVLSGDVDSDGAPSGNAYHVVTASAGVTGSAVLDRLTITGGNADGTGADGSGADGCGGGLRLDGASPTLQNVRIAGNRAVRGGGLCLTGGAAPAIANALIAENTATEAGGGAYADQGSAGAFTHVTITANAAPTGGGLYALDSSPTVHGSIVWDNAGGSLASATSYTLTLTSVVVGEDPGTGNIVYEDAPGELEELIVQAGENTYTYNMLDKTDTQTIEVPGGVDEILISHDDPDYINAFAVNNTWNEPLPDWKTEPDYQSIWSIDQPVDPNPSNTLAIPVNNLNQNGTSEYQASMIPATMPLGENTVASYATPIGETKRWSPQRDDVIWSAVREDQDGNLVSSEMFNTMKTTMDHIESILPINITRVEHQRISDFESEYGFDTSRDYENATFSYYGSPSAGVVVNDNFKITRSDGKSPGQGNQPEEFLEQHLGFEDGPNLYKENPDGTVVTTSNAAQMVNIVYTLKTYPQINQ